MKGIFVVSGMRDDFPKLPYFREFRCTPFPKQLKKLDHRVKGILRNFTFYKKR